MSSEQEFKRENLSQNKEDSEGLMPKTYSFSETEQTLYSAAEKQGLFKAHPSSDKKHYCIMMPPPNVTGALHMGHALTFTLQDIFIRYHRMQGFDVLWQPGTDHASIATQMVVERLLFKNEGKTRFDLGRDEFLNRVWDWKEESGTQITKQLRRLGASTDWSRERFTLDEGLSKAVVYSFTKLYEQGLIYKDKRLVNWDPKLQTAVSDLEVDNTETKGKMYYMRYYLENSSDDYLVVATTRPETFFGDVAVAVNPEDERYKSYIGKKVRLPITGRLIPILADEHADPEKGTGVVKITPAHDFNDFEVGKRHNLEMINIFDLKACLNDEVPENYRGLYRFDARKKIIEELETLDLLHDIQDHMLSLPLSERSGELIEPRMMEQWYVNAKVLAKKAIEAVESGKTCFVPESWNNVYFNWLKNIEPWCISRQLWWGHRIPAWYGPDGHIFVEEDEAQALKKAEVHYEKPTEIKQDEDVLDTWFSSGLWPFSTLGWPEKTIELNTYYPTNLLITGHDIIFFWVARMMMMGLHFMDDVPFKTVYIHSLIRDEKGQKMSKTKGNVIDPLDMIEKYGADALRLSLALQAAPGQDLKFSTDRVEQGRNFVTKLWNAARFCQMNGCEPSLSFSPEAVQNSLNIWVIGETNLLKAKVKDALDHYHIHEASNLLYHFLWGTYCDWYLEMVKPLFQGENSDAETKQTVAYVFLELLKLMHPFMPFVTCKLWEDFGKHQDALSLMNEVWPQFDEILKAKIENDTQVQDINLLKEVISHIRTFRGEFSVPPSLLLRIRLHHDLKAKLEPQLTILKRLARLNDVEWIHEVVHEEGFVESLTESGCSVYVYLKDSISFDQEIIRLEKEITKAEDNIKRAELKLNNKGFMAKADGFVIEEQKNICILNQNNQKKLFEAIERLRKASSL
jgi:valyl-tRNA synthetase